MQQYDRQITRRTSLEAMDEYEHELEGQTILNALNEANARLMCSDVNDPEYRDYRRWMTQVYAKLLSIWQIRDRHK